MAARWIIETKFAPAAAGRRPLERGAVLERLAAAPGGLVVLHAAAGFGKSTLMGQWRRRLLADGWRAAWLNLDEDDRDPGQFLAYLAAALDRRVDGRGVSVGSPAGDATRLPADAVLPALLAGLERDRRPTAIFLDDYHRAEGEAVDRILGSFLERAPPHVGVVVASRSLPALGLARRKAEGRAMVLTDRDLRFSAGETGLFFAEELARVDRRELDRFAERAEGWPVVLQFARMWLGEGGGLAALGGASQASDIAAYLSEQVFAALSPELRAFLLRTAPLGMVSEDLAAAVGVERAGPHIRELVRLGLPIVPLDPERRAFRYHHLLQDFLLARARDEGIDLADIHRRAARRLAADGDLGLAVRHALAGGDAAMAAAIVEAAGGWRLVYRGEGHLGAIVRAVHLAMDDAARGRAPRLMLGVAVVAAKRGDLGEAAAIFERVAAGVGADDRDLADEILVIRALMALYRDAPLGPARTAALGDLVARIDGDDAMHAALATNLLAFFLLEAGTYPQAKRAGERAIGHFRRAEASFGEIHLYAHIGQAELAMGDLAAAEACYRTMRALADRHLGAESDLGAIAAVLAAEARYEAGDAGAARALLVPALARIERADGWLDVFAAGYLTAARLDFLEHGPAAAAAALDRGLGVAGERRLGRLTTLLGQERVRLAALAGDIGAAVAAAAAAGVPLDPGEGMGAEPASPLRGDLVACLAARLALRRGRPADALAFLDAAGGRTPDHAPALGRRLTALALEAVAHHASGRTDLAATRLATAVGLATAGSFRRAILDEGAAAAALATEIEAGQHLAAAARDRVAAFFGRDPAPDAGDRASAVDVGLTAREREILGLLAKGLTNKEIGREIRLDPNTVKYHLKKAFAKLAVERRTGAVARARDFGLID